MDSKLKRQGQRILANAIARLQSNALSRGFFTWKDRCNDDKEKTKLLKKMLAHIKQNKEYAAFRKWTESY
jgi:uncharacterized protein (DUF2252 family)